MGRGWDEGMLKWANHVERMGDEKMAKRADAQKVEGKGCKDD